MPGLLCYYPEAYREGVLKRAKNNLPEIYRNLDNAYRFFDRLCYPDDDEALLAEMHFALGEFLRFVLPKLDLAVDIDSSIEFWYKSPYCPLNLREDNIEKAISCECTTEALLFAKKGVEWIAYEERDFKNRLADYERNLKMSKDGYTQKEFDWRRQNFDFIVKRRTAPIEKILNTPELYARVMAELQRRKEENTEFIKSHGLEL